MQAYVNDMPVAVCVASGSDITAIHEKVFNELPSRPTLNVLDGKMITANRFGPPLEISGSAQVTIRVGELSAVVDVVVSASSPNQCLLGNDFQGFTGLCPDMFNSRVVAGQTTAPFKACRPYTPWCQNRTLKLLPK